MKIRLAAGPYANLNHKLSERRDKEDKRLAFTVCGIRFMWGDVHYKKTQLPLCHKCYASIEMVEMWPLKQPNI